MDAPIWKNRIWLGSFTVVMRIQRQEVIVTWLDQVVFTNSSWALQLGWISALLCPWLIKFNTWGIVQLHAFLLLQLFHLLALPELQHSFLWIARHMAFQFDGIAAMLKKTPLLVEYPSYRTHRHQILRDGFELLRHRLIFVHIILDVAQSIFEITFLLGLLVL